MLIEENQIPIAQETQVKAFDFKLDHTVCAMHGGEDYELLFTIKPEDAEKLLYMIDLKIIGEVIPAEDGIMLHTIGGNMKELVAQGWRHH
jgi:thiamine-monophosphate kinase